MPRLAKAIPAIWRVRKSRERSGVFRGEDDEDEDLWFLCISRILSNKNGPFRNIYARKGRSVVYPLGYFFVGAIHVIVKILGIVGAV